MPKRVYKSDKQALISEAKLILSEGGDAKFIHRVDMVNLVLSSIPVAILSEATGNSVNAITSWVKKADEQGFESLRNKKQPGRPSRLSAEELAEIKQALQKDPREYGLRVWDGPSLSAHIKNKYSKSVGVRQCQRIFHSLGFSLVRPQTFPCPDKQAQDRIDFKKN